VRRALVAIAVWIALSIALDSRAHAHQSSIKYVDITADGSRATVRFTVAPADLTEPLGLPADAQPTAAAAAASPAAAAYVAGWLALSLALPADADASAGAASSACAPAPPHATIDPDGKLVAVTWDATCPAPIERLRIDLAAFFAADARHVAIVALHPPGVHVDPHVARAGQPAPLLHSGQSPSLASWIAYGAHHIFGGLDHVCFVLALLLVVVIARGAGGRWEPRPPRAALRSTAVIVTSFTVAHSLTLAAAALGWLRLPSRLVESAIAASIIYMVIEDVARPDARRRFVVTFGFGLVHGLGFASVLEERLPPGNVVGPLLGFNLGVELGQLAIVAIALPLLAAAARGLGADRYRRTGLLVAALPLGVIATKWLIERALAM
jgi:HupE / UreJ protein